ncbi:MAG: hypothetical protein ACXAC5_14285 [Promethearchaeota archaeon]|jgi:hypothetical protein
MADKNGEKEKLRGFAVIINSVLIPLNENSKFKKDFRKKSAKILLNASNLNHAALIVIDHGSVNVESIPNKPKTNLKKRKVGWNAYLEMDTQSFLFLAMNQKPRLEAAKMWVTRKIKIRGLRRLLLLLKMFKLLSDQSE